MAVPGQVTGLRASDKIGYADLTWGPPAEDANPEIIDYKVEYKEASSDTWKLLVRSAAPVPGARINGLTGGAIFVYRVSAVNAAGVGPATVINPPEKVTGVSAVAGDQQVTLSWNASSNGDNTVSHYRVRYKLPSESAWRAPVVVSTDGPSNGTTVVIRGLENGKSYDFKVRAWGSTAGPWSDVVNQTLDSN
jgi:titin